MRKTGVDSVTLFLLKVNHTYLHKLFCILKQCLPKICKISRSNLEPGCINQLRGIFILGQKFTKNFFEKEDDHQILLYH